MSSFMKENFPKRLKTILTFAGRHLIAPAGNLIISWMVIQFWSPNLWGQFVDYLIWVQLLAHILAWGSREYVIRAFSRLPAAIPSIWRESLLTRALALPIAFGCLGILGLLNTNGIWTCIWLLALFLYQSVDLIVLYKRNYLGAALIELGGMGGIALSIFFLEDQLNTSTLIRIFAVVRLLQLFFIQILARKEVWRKVSFGFRWEHFSQGLPFLLSGLSGLLNSRVDLYQVAIWMDDEQVAIYQVAISLFLYIQAGAGWITGPYVKNFFRLQAASMLKLSSRMLLLGLGLSLLGLAISWLMLSLFFKFDLNLNFYLWGGLMVLPIYGYLPILYLCYKDNRSIFVMIWNFVGVGVNILLNYLLIQSLGLMGALIASAIAQWILFIAYANYYRTRKAPEQG